MTDAAPVLAKRLRKQALSCGYLGSPLYELLLNAAADDAEAHGPTFDLMKDLASAPRGAAIALKLMGSVHRLVLEGEAPELAPYYSSVGGTLEPGGAWQPFRSLLQERRDRLVSLVDRPVQTNEVGRSAGLIGGFLSVAGDTGLPLRILELGASGGLNLRWDHFRYEAGPSTWGPPGSPVRLTGYEGAPPPFETQVEVVERAGCDPVPVDPTTSEGRLTLSSYMWPDQEWRWRALRGALYVAREVPVNVEPSGAGEWLEQRLRERNEGTATVVFHSIVMQYLPGDESARVENLLSDAGSRATKDGPLAWLRMEPPVPGTEGSVDNGLAPVHLTMWPGGESRLIAHCGYHGRPVRWLAGTG